MKLVHVGYKFMTMLFRNRSFSVCNYKSEQHDHRISLCMGIDTTNFTVHQDVGIIQRWEQNKDRFQFMSQNFCTHTYKGAPTIFSPKSALDRAKLTYTNLTALSSDIVRSISTGLATCRDSVVMTQLSRVE